MSTEAPVRRDRREAEEREGPPAPCAAVRIERECVAPSREAIEKWLNENGWRLEGGSGLIQRWLSIFDDELWIAIDDPGGTLKKLSAHYSHKGWTSGDMYDLVTGSHELDPFLIAQLVKDITSSTAWLTRFGEAADAESWTPLFRAHVLMAEAELALWKAQLRAELAETGTAPTKEHLQELKSEAERTRLFFEARKEKGDAR